MSYPIFFLQDLGESLSQGLSISRHRDTQGISQLVVNVKDLENLYIQHDLEQIMLSSATNIQRHQLKKNDVVIAIRGSLLRSSVVTEDSQGSIAGQNVAVFRPKDLDQINPLYIAVLLRSQWMQRSKYMLKDRSSTTLPSIRVSELRELKIPLPEMTIQNEIAQLFSFFESYKKVTLDLLEARQVLTEMSLFKILGD